MEKKPKGVLQNIVTYFCFKVPLISVTKLTKLCYLADVYHYQTYGKRLTKVPFKRYLYGPWSEEVQKTLEKLYDKGIIKEKKVKTKTGQIATTPKPNVPETTINLSKDAFKTLECMVIDWGNKTTDEIVHYCKKTLPFVETPFNKTIDFSRTDEIKEYAKKRGISEKKAATLSVISNKRLLDRTLKGIREAQTGELLSYEEIFS